MFVPPRPRVLIQDQGYELRIDIPPRRDAATIIQWVFMTGWLCGWVMGECFAGWMLLSGLAGLFAGPHVIGAEQAPSAAHAPAGFALIFIGGWLVAWTAGGVMAIRMWLHLMWGRETITVDGNTLSVATYPFARTRQYMAREVSAMEVGTHALQQTRQWRMPQRTVGGGISFTYGAQEYDCGATLDPAEAEMVISEIGRRYKWMVEPPPQGAQNV